MKLFLSLLVLVLLVLLLSLLGIGCATPVPNVEFCGTLSTGAGFCKETLTDTERDVTPEQWAIERNSRLSISPDHVGKLLKFIERVCDRYQNCVAEDIKKARLFMLYMELKLNSIPGG